MLRPRRVNVRRYRNEVGQAHRRRFRQQRHNEQRREKNSLQRDGERQGAPPHFAFPRALLGVAFHQTNTQRAEILSRRASASSGITHLQTFAASDSELLLRRLLQVALQPPAQRSQGCEGARVLLAFDTGNPRKFPPRCRLGARRLGILSCGPPKTAEKKSLGGGVAGRFGMRERVAISL